MQLTSLFFSNNFLPADHHDQTKDKQLTHESSTQLFVYISTHPLTKISSTQLPKWVLITHPSLDQQIINTAAQSFCAYSAYKLTETIQKHFPSTTSITKESAFFSPLTFALPWKLKVRTYSPVRVSLLRTRKTPWPEGPCCKTSWAASARDRVPWNHGYSLRRVSMEPSPGASWSVSSKNNHVRTLKIL